MRVERKTVESYTTKLLEPGRPPSKGGNTRAWHGHYLAIDGERYSFRALGTKRWVYSGDVVSFDWDWDQTRKYRNINTVSISVWDKHGNPVLRGERGSKAWRTATARMPGSRREQRS
jgi:hypothetical protein